MSGCNGSPYPVLDPRMPQQAPIRLQGQGRSSLNKSSPPFSSPPDKSGSSNGTTTTIENGRIVRGQSRRRAFFSAHLRRVGQLLRDPRQITWREVCGFTFGGYALYTLLQTLYHIGYVMTIWLLLCVSLGSEPESSTGECVKFSFGMSGMMIVDWLSRVVPWGFICVAAVFAGEELLRRRR